MGTEWTPADIGGTLQVLDVWWDLLTDGVATDLVEAAPGDAPSVAELRATSIARLVDAEGCGTADVGAVLDGVLADLSAAGRTLARLGVAPAREQGVVAGVHRSGGGVPKRPVPAAVVGPRGVAGDRQADRRFHGRVWQALCLWSLDVIEALAAEGHPVEPGAAGENLTLAGVDWSQLRPGTRLRAGGVLAELSLPAAPCAKNARWFLDGDFMRMSHDRHPGWSRWYATVVEPGDVAVGDAVTVEPDLRAASGPAHPTRVAR